MFTQKHYKAIARWLRSIKPEPENYEFLKQWNITVETFIFEFSQDNPNFKVTLFKHAAGYAS